MVVFFDHTQILVHGVVPTRAKKFDFVCVAELQDLVKEPFAVCVFLILDYFPLYAFLL